MMPDTICTKTLTPKRIVNSIHSVKARVNQLVVENWRLRAQLQGAQSDEKQERAVLQSPVENVHRTAVQELADLEVQASREALAKYKMGLEMEKTRLEAQVQTVRQKLNEEREIWARKQTETYEKLAQQEAQTRRLEHQLEKAQEDLNDRKRQSEELETVLKEVRDQLQSQRAVRAELENKVELQRSEMDFLELQRQEDHETFLERLSQKESEITERTAEQGEDIQELEDILMKAKLAYADILRSLPTHLLDKSLTIENIRDIDVDILNLGDIIKKLLQTSESGAKPASVKAESPVSMKQTVVKKEVIQVKKGPAKVEEPTTSTKKVAPVKAKEFEATIKKAPEVPAVKPSLVKPKPAEPADGVKSVAKAVVKKDAALGGSGAKKESDVVAKKTVVKETLVKDTLVKETPVKDVVVNEAPAVKDTSKTLAKADVSSIKKLPSQEKLQKIEPLTRAVPKTEPVKAEDLPVKQAEEVDQLSFMGQIVQAVKEIVTHDVPDAVSKVGDGFKDMTKRVPDTSLKEPIAKAPLRNKSPAPLLRKDSAMKFTSPENLKGALVKKEGVIKEAGVKKEGPAKDFVRKETSSKESSRRESVVKELSKKELSMKEPLIKKEGSMAELSTVKKATSQADVKKDEHTKDSLTQQASVSKTLVKQTSDGSKALLEARITAVKTKAGSSPQSLSDDSDDFRPGKAMTGAKVTAVKTKAGLSPQSLSDDSDDFKLRKEVTQKAAGSKTAEIKADGVKSQVKATAMKQSVNEVKSSIAIDAKGGKSKAESVTPSRVLRFKSDSSTSSLGSPLTPPPKKALPKDTPKMKEVAKDTLKMKEIAKDTLVDTTKKAIKDTMMDTAKKAIKDTGESTALRKLQSTPPKPTSPIPLSTTEPPNLGLEDDKSVDAAKKVKVKKKTKALKRSPSSTPTETAATTVSENPARQVAKMPPKIPAKASLSMEKAPVEEAPAWDIFGLFAPASEPPSTELKKDIETEPDKKAEPAEPSWFSSLFAPETPTAEDPVKAPPPDKEAEAPTDWFGGLFASNPVEPEPIKSAPQLSGDKPSEPTEESWFPSFFGGTTETPASAKAETPASDWFGGLFGATEPQSAPEVKASEPTPAPKSEAPKTPIARPPSMENEKSEEDWFGGLFGIGAPPPPAKSGSEPEAPSFLGGWF